MKSILLTCWLVITSFTVQTAVDAAQPLRPAELDTLNYTQVLFQWPPQAGAASYRLQIAGDVPYNPFETALISAQDCETNALLLPENLDWGSEYIWRYWGLNELGKPLDTSYIHSFRIVSFPDSLRIYTLTATNPEAVQPGLTLFDLRRPTLIAVDVQGEPVWFTYPGGRDVQLLTNGHMLYTEGATRSEAIVEANVDGQELFRSPTTVYHHEVDKMPNGNYLALSTVRRPVMDPYGADTTKLWEGDLLIELNPQGEVVWSWNVFDHFDTLDFDSLAFAANARQAVFDWTHGNAAHLTPDGKAIYMSFRHLSRVTMISYPEGEIIWNIGRDYASDDVSFGQNLNFSYQHNPQMLPNGNFILYDNHNLGPESTTRALEFSIDIERNPVTSIVWEHWLDSLSADGGDAERLANGNTLMSNRPLDEIIEVSPDGTELWHIENPPNSRGMYRVDRIPDLYPLVYTIKGPEQDEHVPANASYFQFTLNNVGHSKQTFRYMVTDSEGWFEHEGYVTIDAHSSANRMIFGQANSVEATDTVSIDVYPILDPSRRDSWTVNLISDPTLSIGTTDVPAEWNLFSSYPNPFNNSTQLSFDLLEQSRVQMSIFDLNGRLVRTLLDDVYSAGSHRIEWTGTDQSGVPLGSGVYIVRLDNSHQIQIRALTLVR